MSESGVPASKDVVIRTSGVGYQYPKSESWAVRGIDFSVTSGSVHAVVGPNGSGKSTLLKLVTGALRPAEGTAELWGKPVRSWAPRDLAQRLAVVTQREAPAFPVTVRDLVAAGRYAHLGPFRSETAGDREAVEQALEQCGIPDLAGRSVRELSGGEFQRARIARALAQEPKILVLDEPTSALDVRYQMSILALLIELRETRALTVVFVTHRLALASRFADTLLLLHHGHVVREGDPRFVLHSETLSEVYGWPLAVLDVDVPRVGPVPMIIPQSRQES